MEVDVRETSSDESEQNEEELECDISVYTLFHEGNTGSPCLSFDIVRDTLGMNRDCETPVTCYFVSGSQANETHLNNIVLLKMSNLHKVKEEKSDDEDESDDDDESELPIIHSVTANHRGCVNRIRAASYDEVNLAATWSELGEVNIWDLNPMLKSVNESQTTSLGNIEPLFKFTGHKQEGFAVDWSPIMHGTLATGDCSKAIHVWHPTEGGSWAVGAKAFKGHTASVEDIQWSPNEPNVFVSSSVDRSIRVWDAREDPDRACKLTCNDAHDKDVNVVHWNRNDAFIVSGGDDGKVLVWDLRKFESGVPVAHLQYHNGPVCTVEWHPTDSSVLMSGGEDDCVLQWDLGVEKDPQSAAAPDDDKDDVPQQLLFVHKGLKEVKEVHWHPQVPGLVISTAHSGFNIFKTISC